MHKDYVAALEHGRRTHFSMARPVNDFFHLSEKKNNIEAKLANLTLQNKVHVKTEYGWVMACLSGLRDIPSIDLFSALWDGFLRRLRVKGETVLSEYLGPDGVERYTQRLSVAALRAMGIFSNALDSSPELLFCAHWSGILGILPGTDCGDQSLEAFHSPWAKHLEALGKDATSTQVLSTMQDLYGTWSQQCEWKSEEALQVLPPDVDPQHLSGTLLSRVGRSTGIEFWERARRMSPSTLTNTWRS